MTVGPGYTTSVVYATSTYTVTACPTYVKNCPVGSVTTEIQTMYTTMISDVVEPKVTLPVYSFTPSVIYSTVLPPSGPGLPNAPSALVPQPSSTVAVVPQPISSPAGSYSSGIYGTNSSVPTGTEAIALPTKSESGLTPTDTLVFSGAGQVKVGSILAFILAAFVMLF